VAYEDYEALLDEGEVDAVYVGVPNALHAEFAIPALKRGMHVLCEKPLAESVESCRAMIATAKKSGAKLMTAYRLHFDPTNLNIISEIRKVRLEIPNIFNQSFRIKFVKKIRGLKKRWQAGRSLILGYIVSMRRVIYFKQNRKQF
jgi:predicted dehydrogenase